MNIRKRVYLPSNCLDKNLERHLLNKVKTLTETECTQEYGYVLCVNRIIKYENIDDTVFLVDFEAETLKPEEGKRVTGKVCMIFKDGIFINIKDRQKMLITASSLEPYKFDQVSKTYVNGKSKISDGDELEAVILAVRYSDQKFSCYGSLVKK